MGGCAAFADTNASRRAAAPAGIRAVDWLPRQERRRVPSVERLDEGPGAQRRLDRRERGEGRGLQRVVDSGVEITFADAARPWRRDA